MSKTKFNLATNGNKQLVLANKKLKESDYEEAINYYKKAIEFYVEAKNKTDNSMSKEKPILDNLHNCYNNMGASYINWAKTENPEENLLEAIKILEEGLKEFTTSTELTKQKVSTHNNLSKYYKEQGKLEEAITQWKFVEKTGEEKSDVTMFNLKTSLAKSKVEAKVANELTVKFLTKAFDYVKDKGKEFAKQNLINTNYVCSHLVKYKLLKGDGNLSEAIEFSNKANEIDTLTTCSKILQDLKQDADHIYSNATSKEEKKPSLEILIGLQKQAEGDFKMNLLDDLYNKYTSFDEQDSKNISGDIGHEYTLGDFGF